MTQAQNAVWLGTSSDDWQTPANWDPAAVPGSGTTVFVDTNAGNQPHLTFGNSSIGQLIIGDTSSSGNQTALFVTTDGLMNTTIIRVGNSTDSQGELWLSDPDAGVTASGRAFVGFAGDGAVTVTNSAHLQTAGGSLGGDFGSPNTGFGAVLITANGTWTSTSTFYVGQAGGGGLIISAGGALSNTLGSIGEQSGSQGAALVTGTGSLWNSTGPLFVGNSGFANFTVADGAQATTGQFGSIGLSPGGNGTATITGPNSRWIADDELFVGDGGRGLLNILNGGVVDSGGSSTVGYANGANGTAVIAGNNSFWNVSGPLIIGDSGRGSVTVGDGGTLSVSGALVVGGNATGDGTFLINGGGVLYFTGDAEAGLGLANITSNGGTFIFGGAGQEFLMPLHIANVTTEFHNDLPASISGVLSGDAGFLKTGNGILTVTGNNTFSGGVSVLGGTLNVLNPGNPSPVGTGPLFVGPNGTISGTGLIGGNATVLGIANISGILVFEQALEFDANAVAQFALQGTLPEIESFDFGAESLAILERGVDYGAIDINGPAILDGTLRVVLLSGFEPALGDSFELLRYGGSVTGNFSTFDLPSLTEPGWFWDTSAINTTGFLTVAVPEPAHLAAWLGAAAIGLAALRRKKHPRRA